MEQEKNDKKPSLNKKIIPSIIVAVIIIAVAWYLFADSSDSASDNNNSFVSDSNTSITDNTNDIVNDNVNIAKVENNDPDAIKRDEERVVEIKDIREKLDSFNTDKGNYPENLEELVTEGYYSDLPVNPTPGGIDYVYTPIGSLPAKFYDLAYTLEAGTDELEAGEHIANPDSISFP